MARIRERRAIVRSRFTIPLLRSYKTFYWIMAAVMISGLAFFFFPGRTGNAPSSEPAPQPTSVAETPASGAEASPQPEGAANKSYATPPPFTIEKLSPYFANIETEKGVIRALLSPREAANTVNNFVFLARNGFYDNMTFKLEPGVSLVSGDAGTAGPSYTLPREDSDLKHGKGAVAMVSDGNVSNGSQFAISLAPQSELDGKRTVFGQVVEGLDVAGSLGQEDKILKITIEGP